MRNRDRHRDIWISGKARERMRLKVASEVGDSRSRCLATSLHQKGYEAQAGRQDLRLRKYKRSRVLPRSLRCVEFEVVLRQLEVFEK